MKTINITKNTFEKLEPLMISKKFSMEKLKFLN